MSSWLLGETASPKSYGTSPVEPRRDQKHVGSRFPNRLGVGDGHDGALYVAVALTFSSTIIIVKLLSDKRELEELHGRIVSS